MTLLCRGQAEEEMLDPELIFSNGFRLLMARKWADEYVTDIIKGRRALQGRELTKQNVAEPEGNIASHRRGCKGRDRAQ